MFLPYFDVLCDVLPNRPTATWNLCVLYNDVNAMCVVIGHCPWYIRVQIHGWRHAKLVFFVLFNMARGFENVWDYFGLKKVKSSKKVQQELFTRKKNIETGQKKLLTTLECLNYKKSSQQLPPCVIAMRDSQICEMFSRLIWFERVKVLKKLFGKTV